MVDTPMVDTPMVDTQLVCQAVPLRACKFRGATAVTENCIAIQPREQKNGDAAGISQLDGLVEGDLVCGTCAVGESHEDASEVMFSVRQFNLEDNVRRVEKVDALLLLAFEDAHVAMNRINHNDTTKESLTTLRVSKIIRRYKIPHATFVRVSVSSGRSGRQLERHTQLIPANLRNLLIGKTMTRYGQGKMFINDGHDRSFNLISALNSAESRADNNANDRLMITERTQIIFGGIEGNSEKRFDSLENIQGEEDTLNAFDDATVNNLCGMIGGAILHRPRNMLINGEHENAQHNGSRSAMLIGPTGTGITTLVGALSALLKVPLVTLSVPSLLASSAAAPYSSDSEGLQHALMHTINCALAQRPCILYMDDLELLAPPVDNMDANETVEEVIAKLKVTKILCDFLDNVRGAGSTGQLPGTQACASAIPVTDNASDDKGGGNPPFVSASNITGIFVLAHCSANKTFGKGERKGFGRSAAQLEGVEVEGSVASRFDEVISLTSVKSSLGYRQHAMARAIALMREQFDANSSLPEVAKSTVIRFLDSIDVNAWVDQLANVASMYVSDLVARALSEAVSKLIPQPYECTDGCGAFAGTKEMFLKLESMSETLYTFANSVTAQPNEEMENRARALDIPVLPAGTSSGMRNAPEHVVGKAGGGPRVNPPGFALTGWHGDDDVRRQLEEAILLPRLYPDLFRRFSIAPDCGILLFGPPGTGKTLLPSILAKELGVRLVCVRISDVIQGAIGAGEQAIAEAFSEARRAAPSIIFIDEFQALFTSRSASGTDSRDSVGASLTSALASCFDDLNVWNQSSGSNAAVIVIGATNEPWAVDQGFLRPGRFGRKLLIGPLSEKGRLEMLVTWYTNIHKKYIAITEHDEGERVDAACGRAAYPEWFDDLAESCELYTGADMAALINRACAIHTSSLSISTASSDSEGNEGLIQLHEIIPSKESFTEAQSSMAPSVTAELLRSYHEVNLT